MTDNSKKPLNQNNLWDSTLTYYAWGATLLLMLIMSIIFFDHLVHPIWIFATIFVVFIYFYLVNNMYFKWKEINPRLFVKNLFISAFLARVIYMTVITTLAQLETGNPFYIGAVDAVTYSRMAGDIGELIRNFDFGSVFPTLQTLYSEPDNWGPPFFVGIVYAFLGESPVIAKLFYNLMGAGTVYYTYKTTRLVWDEQVARLASILLAFFPLALFYSSVILKEEFVVFLLMFGTFSLVKFLKGDRFNILAIVSVILSTTLLFLFRIPAGALFIVTSLAAIVLYKSKGLTRLYMIVTGIIFLISSLYFINTIGDLDFYFEELDTYEQVYENRISGAARQNIFVDYAGLPIYTALSFFSPFPSVVHLETRFGTTHDNRYYEIAGIIIWNFLVIFGLIGGWKALTNNFSSSIPVVGFVVGYVLILALTGLFTRVRLNYNAMPFMFILIAVGLQYLKYKKLWPFYLIISIGLIIAWNYFRIAGRGLF